jgi:hypothetical protein
MATVSTDVSKCIKTFSRSSQVAAGIHNFLEEALKIEPGFDCSLGNPGWHAIDLWNSGRRIGLIFPTKGVVKIFNVHKNARAQAYAAAILNNRNEWEFDIERSSTSSSILRCIADNRMSIEVRLASRQISARVRFSVFVRDKYTCQYCGRKGPDISLHLDHRLPVSLGGSNDESNLLTACSECNLGKSNKFVT